MFHIIYHPAVFIKALPFKDLFACWHMIFLSCICDFPTLCLVLKKEAASSLSSFCLPLHISNALLSSYTIREECSCIFCLTYSVSDSVFDLQWHHRQGPGQALPPRVLRVRRLQHQPQAQGLLLHRGQSVLWDPRQGTRPASRGIRRGCCLPQLQGGAGVRQRWRSLHCIITERAGLLSLLANIYQALSSRNADLGSALPLGEAKEMCVFSDPRPAFLRRQAWQMFRVSSVLKYVDRTTWNQWVSLILKPIRRRRKNSHSALSQPDSPRLSITVFTLNSRSKKNSKTTSGHVQKRCSYAHSQPHQHISRIHQQETERQTFMPLENDCTSKQLPAICFSHNQHNILVQWPSLKP